MKYNNKSNICAIVTTFKPEVSIFKNLRRIGPQVDLVILVDDSGINSGSLDLAQSDVDNLFYIKSLENLGVASALNTGVMEAIQRGYKWLLTLDDDTLVSEDYVKTIFEFYDHSGIPDIGLIACTRETYCHGQQQSYGYKIKRTLITSGSVFHSDLYLKCGGFIDKLFIDLVDFDFCTKIRKMGYKLILLDRCAMEHKVGNSRLVGFAKFQVVVYHHSPNRLYYQARNVFFFMREHFFYDPFLTVYLLLDVFRLPLKAIFFEADKIKRLKFIANGVWHGINGRYGRIN